MNKYYTIIYCDVIKYDLKTQIYSEKGFPRIFADMEKLY